MGNNKQLVKNAIFNLLQFFINFSISFFFTPYIIRTIGKEAYSFFPIVNNFIGYSSVVTTAVGSMAARFITLRIYKNDYEGATYYFNSVLVANWILSIFFTFVSVLCVVYLPYILTIPLNLISEIRLLFSFACASMILGLATGILGTGTFVKNRLDASASRTVISNILRVVCILLFFALFKPSIVYMSLSAFIAAILSAYYNFRFKRKFLPELPVNPQKYFNLSYLKELMGSSIWNSVDQLSFLLLSQLDLLISNIFIGVVAAADYSIAKMMPMLIQSLVSVLVGVFIPQFTILYAQEKGDALISEINKSIKIMGICTTIPIGILIVYSGDFFRLWIKGQYSDDITLLSILTLIPMVISSCINTLFNIFTVTNKLKIPALALLFVGLLNTGIVFILLKYTGLGVFAIPISSMITLILKNITFTPMYAAHCLKQNIFIFHKDILLGCSSCLIVLLFGYLCKHVLPSDTWPSFFLSGFIVASLSLLCSSCVYLNKRERSFIINKIITKVIIARKI